MPNSQRSTTLASRLGYELHLLGRSGFRRPWTAFFAYPWLAVRTIGILIKCRPRVAIVIAPPFVASLIALPLTRLLGTRLAIDIHSGAMLDRRWRWSVPIMGWLVRRSMTGIVTLESLAARLRSLGASVVVLPDPLPTPLEPAPMETAFATGSVVAICGWGQDEPIDALIDSARGEPWTLVVTGRVPTVRERDLPSNVQLSGFVDDREYAELIRTAAVVVVLTTRDETLLSGAWEALAYRRPLVLSYTNALTTTFGPSVTYVGPDSSSIRHGVSAVLSDPVSAQRAASLLADRFQSENDVALLRLQAIIEDRVNR